MGIEQLGTGLAGLINPPPAPYENDVNELRRRMRACVIELTARFHAAPFIRFTLFQVIDHASPATLRAMRERIWELVA